MPGWSAPAGWPARSRAGSTSPRSPRTGRADRRERLAVARAVPTTRHRLNLGWLMTDRPVSELLAGASHRELVQPPDGKSASTFERATIDGERYFVKRQSRASDWIMRMTGDQDPAAVRRLARRCHEAVPRDIDHTMVAMELEGEGESAELTMLMRDVSDRLVPEGDTTVSQRTHRLFVDHLACLSKAFWGFTDTIGGLTRMLERLRYFAARQRRAASWRWPSRRYALVAAEAGWRALPDRLAALAGDRRPCQDHPSLLTEPLAQTPVTFLHGDWKMGNLGSHPDGRTILLDWAYPGSGPACWDLALVPRAEPGAPAGVEGGDHRSVPGRPARVVGSAPTGLVRDRSSTCAWPGPWRPSAGRRRSATRPSCAGGKRSVPKRGPAGAGPPRCDGRPLRRGRTGLGRGCPLVYGPIARALVDAARTTCAAGQCSTWVRGPGLASDVLVGYGARVVAMDLSVGMLAWRASRSAAVVADMTRAAAADRRRRRHGVRRSC